jgi:GNAT superfamily N-acetyltransferase
MAIVRTATEKDIPRILELYRQLALNPPPANAPGPSLEDCHKVFAEMSATPGYSLLLAEENGEILGTTVLAILPGLAHGTSPFAVVEYVVVDEKRRGQGIGKLLMDYVIARSREAGCYKIMLTSDKRRKQAHKFYRALGFEASAHGFRLYF